MSNGLDVFSSLFTPKFPWQWLAGVPVPFSVRAFLVWACFFYVGIGNKGDLCH